MNRKLLKSAAMALVLSAGLADLRPRRRHAQAGRHDRRHLQGRHRDARSGHRLRLAELVDDQQPVLAPRRLQVRHDRDRSLARRQLDHLARRAGLHLQAQPEGQVHQWPEGHGGGRQIFDRARRQPEDAGTGRRLLPFDRRPGQDGGRLGDDHLRHRDARRLDRQVHAEPARRHLPQRARAQFRFRGAEGSRRGGGRRFRQEAGRLGRLQA